MSDAGPAGDTFHPGDRVYVAGADDGDDEGGEGDPIPAIVIERWVSRGPDLSGTGQGEVSIGGPGTHYACWLSLTEGETPITASLEDHVVVARGGDLSPRGGSSAGDGRGGGRERPVEGEQEGGR